MSPAQLPALREPSKARERHCRLREEAGGDRPWGVGAVGGLSGAEV